MITKELGFLDLFLDYLTIYVKPFNAHHHFDSLEIPISNSKKLISNLLNRPSFSYIFQARLFVFLKSFKLIIIKIDNKLNISY